MAVPVPDSEFDICSIITVLAADSSFVVRVEEARRQTGLVVVVDDSGDLASQNALRSYLEGHSQVLVCANKENCGVGRALNVGVGMAREQGFRWVLTLDSDTKLLDNMVQQLLAGFREAMAHPSRSKPIGLIGMSWAREFAENCKPSSPERSGWRETRGLITAGSLFSIETYDKVGPFREQFFVDLIDYDYCLRARSKGFRVVQLGGRGFIQPLGKISSRRIAGKIMHTFEYGPGRLYYQFRNGAVLFREYWSKEPLYAFGALIWFCRTVWRILLCEEDRKAKLLYCFKGLKDGVARRLGKTVPV